MQNIIKNFALYKNLSKILDDRYQYRTYHLYDNIYIFHARKYDVMHFLFTFGEYVLTKSYIVSIDETNQEVRVLFDGYLPNFIEFYHDKHKECVLMGWNKDLEPGIICLKGNDYSFNLLRNSDGDEFVKNFNNRLMKTDMRFLSEKVGKNRFLLLTNLLNIIILIYNQGKKHLEHLHIPGDDFMIVKFLKNQIDYLSLGKRIVYLDDRLNYVSAVIGNVNLDQSAKILNYHIDRALDGSLYLFFTTDDSKVYCVDTQLTFDNISPDIYLEPDICFEPESKTLIYREQAYHDYYIKHNIITNEKEKIPINVEPNVILRKKVSVKRKHKSFWFLPFAKNASDYILFKEKKKDTVILQDSNYDKIAILTQDGIYDECYFVESENDNNYYLFVNQKKLFCKLIKRDSDGKYQELQELSLKDQNSFDFQIYHKARYCCNMRKRSNLFVLQIDNDFYIFNKHVEKFVKLDLPKESFVNVFNQYINVFELDNFCLIEYLKNNFSQYSFYYKTEKCFVFDNNNNFLHFCFIKLPVNQDYFIYIASQDNSIQNFYMIGYDDKQIKVKKENYEIFSNYVKNFLMSVCTYKISDYDSKSNLLSLSTASLDPIHAYRLYHFYMKLESTLAFTKGFTKKLTEKSTSFKDLKI